MVKRALHRIMLMSNENEIFDKEAREELNKKSINLELMLEILEDVLFLFEY
jgi:hypothetical protein